MIIEVQNLQKTITPNISQLVKITRRILSKLAVTQGQLSLVLVSDQKIRALNKKFLRRDHVTDVLAFDFSPKRSLSSSWPIAGEIIISCDTAKRNAKIYEVPVREELVLYVIHGILHLRGYDDHTPRERQEMRCQESRVLDAVRPLLTRMKLR